MSLFHFITQSLRHYWRGHLGLLFGTLLASSILSGSLVVGDSVRASLRRVADLRIGRVQSALIGGDRFLTTKLAEAAAESLKPATVAPVILMSGSAGVTSGEARVNGIQVMGVDESFWKLGPSGKAMLSEKMDFAVNASLAARLGVKVGDTIVIRVEQPGALSRDAPLSGATDTDVAIRRKITAVVGAEDFGSFQLAAQQRPPDTAYLPLVTLQEQIEQGGRANTLLIGGEGAIDPAKVEATLAQHASLDDYSLKLTEVKGAGSEWELSTSRVFLDPVVADEALKREKGAYGVLTYLVNRLSMGDKSVPYSMVTAVDRLGAEDGMVINQWLADELGAKVGDELRLRFFVVGLGRDLKESEAAFKVKRILPMTDPEVSRAWTPDFPGVSDAENCRDWEPGIPMDMKAIRDQDEKYWDDYKGTPKAFISLEAGRKLWSNRFGSLTAVRFPREGRDEASARKEVLQGLQLRDVGFHLRALKQEAHAAAKGSVDFGGLFVGLSLFLIAAALVFASLLFLFTLERRASQVGLLTALGWPQKKVRNALLVEAGLVALAGSVAGIFGGIVYTRLALLGLGGAWSGAAAGLKLVYAAEPLTFVISGFAAFFVALGTLWLASRRLFKTPPRSLLAGEAWGEGAPAGTGGKKGRWRRLLSWQILALTGVVGAAVLSWAGSGATDPEEIAGMFFGAGSLLLMAALALASAWMHHLQRGADVVRSVWQIGVRNVVRRPGRSLAVLGMMAGGIFLVAAVNAFRMSADADPTQRDTGTGGFALIGESSLPLYEDLNSKAGRDAFGLEEEDMAGITVVPFRVRQGDDASCLNLNRAQRPVLTAVNPAPLEKWGAFRFVGIDAAAAWKKLAEKSSDGAIPAIADQATAMWGLQKGVGDTIDYEDSAGRTFQVRLVALLGGSVLQGKMIISEQAFLAKYPDTAGYRFLLIDAPEDRAAAVSAALTRQMEPRGLALEPAIARLEAFNSVQNTYIGIFTILGGLGVLLGTAGLGVLVARHVMERRGELGLMQAIGFRPAALRSMILGEHAALLVAGVVAGVLAALIAVWPNLKQGSGHLPVATLGALVVGILFFGLGVCALAVIAAVRGRLIDSIRRE